jgi:cell division protein FtsW
MARKGGGMSLYVGRTDQSVLGRWWWTVDRFGFGAMLLLAALGIVLVTAASPAVAHRIGLPGFFFVERHFIYLAPCLGLMFGISLLDPAKARRLALLALLGGWVLMVMVLFMGDTTKGATRWLHLAGFSIQPSEFVKPALAVVAAWLFARKAEGREDGRPFPGYSIAFALYGITIALLVAQPDLGMTMLTTAVFFAQFYLAGLRLFWVFAAGGAGLGGLVAAYQFMPHVQSRINRFLDPESGDTYQVDRSIEAFGNGGLFGTGPGQGQVKLVLPDAHADFIFSVAGEEFGIIFCLLLVGLYALIVFFAIRRLLGETDLFAFLAGSGLVMQFGLQALIHMGSALHLMPAKGMTLPLVSYGGSSLVATGFALGLLLAMTRKRPRAGTVLGPARTAGVYA